MYPKSAPSEVSWRVLNWISAVFASFFTVFIRFCMVFDRFQIVKKRFRSVSIFFKSVFDDFKMFWKVLRSLWIAFLVISHLQKVSNIGFWFVFKPSKNDSKTSSFTQCKLPRILPFLKIRVAHGRPNFRFCSCTELSLLWRSFYSVIR